MESYNVVITEKAESQLASYTDYICYTLLNKEATRRVLADVRETTEQLAIVAGSLQYCRHPLLRKMEYRFIVLRRHRYVMLYRIENENVYVEAIYHQLQDYENSFADELSQADL